MSSASGTNGFWHSLRAERSLVTTDQLIFSVGNFLTTVLASHILTPHQFGLFSLLNTAYLVIVGLANTLVTEPLRVLGINRDESAQGLYISCQAILRVLTLLPVVIAALLCARYFAAGVDGIGGAFSCFCLIWLVHEFSRSINAIRREWVTVLKGDFLCHALRICALVLLVGTDADSMSDIFWIMCAGSLIAVLPGPAWTASPEFPSTANLRAAWEENWDFGRWLFFESLVFIASTQIYVFWIGMSLSPTDAGGLVAAQVFANLLNPLLAAATVLFTVNGRAALLEGGYASWRGLFVRGGLFVVAAASAICVVLVLCRKQAMSLIFAPELAAYSYLVMPAGIAMFLTVANSILNVAFRTAKKPYVGFRAKLFSALVTIAVGNFLIRKFGVLGAAYGYVLTQLIWLMVYAYEILVRRRLSQASVDSSGHGLF